MHPGKGEGGGLQESQASHKPSDLVISSQSKAFFTGHEQAYTQGIWPTGQSPDMWEGGGTTVQCPQHLRRCRRISTNPSGQQNPSQETQALGHGRGVSGEEQQKESPGLCQPHGPQWDTETRLDPSGPTL